MASVAIRSDRARRLQTPTPGNLGALEYLQQCLDQKRPVAVIIGARGSGKAMLLRRFLHYRTAAPVAFARIPTEDPHAFLESILLQFGLEAFDSSLSELRNLAMVFVRHQAGKGVRPIVVVENAQKCGQRVLELIELLSQLDIGGEAALLFILTGTRELNNRLEMPAMTERCDLDALNAIPIIPSAEVDHHYGRLEVRLGDNLVSEHVIDRRQLLIGRKTHSDICLTGRYVSRHHAVLISRPDSVYIVDLKSTNGLCVNSEIVRRQALVSGDVISISNYRLIFIDDSSTPAETEPDEATDGLSQTVAMRRQMDTGLTKTR